MKTKYVRLLSLIVCVAVIFTVIALTRTELHGAASDTVLFFNDRTWTISSRLPAEQVHDVYYVPISLFVQLPSVDVRTNESLGTFVITHGDLFLSFDTNTDFVMNQDKERAYLKTAKYHNERYVPVRIVCAYLELGYEETTNAVTGVTAIRITDGNERIAFEDLIKSKYPSLFPNEPITTTQAPVTTEPPPVTTTSKPPVVTTAPPTTTSKPPVATTEPIESTADTTSAAPTLSERTVYITVEGCTGAYTPAILSALKRYGYKATFFVSESELGDDASLLSKICASGHELALSVPTPLSQDVADDGALLDSIARQNQWLNRLIKKTSRVWSFATSSAVQRSASTELAAKSVENGYIMWNATVDVPTGKSASAAAQIAIDAIWENETVTLRFREAGGTSEALRLVLAFIKENEDVCDVRVICPSFYE